MTAVADSHALVWYLQRSQRLSAGAGRALAEAERDRSLIVSVATLIDLWYVTQTTQGVTLHQLEELRASVDRSVRVSFHSVTVDVADASNTIPRTLLSDPWDRLIVATAMVLDVELVTRDEAIRGCGLVRTVW